MDVVLHFSALLNILTDVSAPPNEKKSCVGADFEQLAGTLAGSKSCLWR